MPSLSVAVKVAVPLKSGHERDGVGDVRRALSAADADVLDAGAGRGGPDVDAAVIAAGEIDGERRRVLRHRGDRIGRRGDRRRVVDDAAVVDRRALLRGFGAPTVKSEALLFVSVQPLLLRSAAVVLASTAVGLVSEQLAVGP